MKKILNNVVSIFKKSKVKYPDTYLEELDDQCTKFSFVLSIMAIFIWIRYIKIDMALYPEETFMPYLRYGLILVGSFNILIHVFAPVFKYKGIILLSILSFYYIEASAILAGLSKAGGPYFAGYIVSVLVVLFTPLPKFANYFVTITSILTFFIIIYTSHIDLAGQEIKYFLSLGLNVLVLSSTFIYILDRARFRSYRKSKEIEHKIEEIERQKQIVEESKNEISILNEFTKSLNDNPDLDIILEKVFGYIINTYNIDFVWLNMISEDKQYIYNYKYSTSVNLSEESAEFLNKFKEPLINETGAFYTVYKRIKTLYMVRQLDKFLKTNVDKKIVKALGLKSFLLVPLFVKKNVIGVICFTNQNTVLKLNKDSVARIERFCEQIAGAIQTSYLLKQVQVEKEKSERLLLNILPEEVAVELKEKGFAEPVLFESVSVLFTDFKGFTKIAESMSPQELIKELDACFVQFDSITRRYNLEKLKTIGDSYMCAGGIPRQNKTHAIDSVLAALEIQYFMDQMKQIRNDLGFPYWELRLGIHTGPLVAGVIGERKFAYDVWGDTVNTASRMESSGTPGKINISGATYELVKEFFDCEYRGKVNAKNKGEIDMYYVNRIKLEYSKGGEGKIPNDKFWDQVKLFNSK